MILNRQAGPPPLLCTCRHGVLSIYGTDRAGRLQGLANTEVILPSALQRETTALLLSLVDMFHVSCLLACKPVSQYHCDLAIAYITFYYV